MAEMRCTYCGSGSLEPGFVSTFGQGASFAYWVQGQLKRGIFGGARQVGRARWEIDAYRCTSCAHVEIFAQRPS